MKLMEIKIKMNLNMGIVIVIDLVDFVKVCEVGYLVVDLDGVVCGFFGKMKDLNGI